MNIINKIKRLIFSRESTEVRNVLLMFILSVPLIGITLFCVNKYSEEIYEYFESEIDRSYIENERNYLANVLSRSESTDSFKYDMEISSTVMEIGTGKFQQKGDKMKIEGEVNGIRSVVFINSINGKVHIYDNIRENIIEAEIENTPGILDSSMKAQGSELLNKDPRIIAREDIEDKGCLVVEYSEGGGTGKMWIWEEKGLPIKINPAIIDQSGITSLEAKNIDFADIPDSVFELPEGIPVTVAPPSPSF